MSKDDLKVRMVGLLSDFNKEHDLSPEEIDVISTSFATLIYSERVIRNVWYSEMVKTSKLISQLLKEKYEIGRSKLSEEDKKILDAMVKSKEDKNKKVEN
jgi:hypothetical protein